MEDNFLNTEELERMLGPQCEFHASEGLKDKVMNEARAVSRPRRLRLIPWLAAACVAGILVIFLTPPKDSGMATSGNFAATTSESSTAADIGQTGQPGSVKTKTSENPKKEKLIAVVPAGRKHDVTRRAQKKRRQTGSVKATAIHGACITETFAIAADTLFTTGSPDEEQWMTVISETDLPITCPENLNDTPEDIEQKKRLQRLAYINKINLEIEIASHRLQQIAQIN
ncbi:MAG: hypothetical protein J6C05_03525 [Prevotella sp.]|nr:hypothetical protein [Prevotella sp.]